MTRRVQLLTNVAWSPLMPAVRALLSRVARLEQARVPPVSPFERDYGSVNAFAASVQADIEAGVIDPGTGRCFCRRSDAGTPTRCGACGNDHRGRTSVAVRVAGGQGRTTGTPARRTGVDAPRAHRPAWFHAAGRVAERQRRSS